MYQNLCYRIGNSGEHMQTPAMRNSHNGSKGLAKQQEIHYIHILSVDFNFAGTLKIPGDFLIKRCYLNDIFTSTGSF